MDDISIYLDNAATSYPKPEPVYQAMDRFARQCGGSAGRASHRRAIDAASAVDATREALAELLRAEAPESVCFCQNATDALNTAIFGLARPGAHVVTTSMEHNSVWRPLKQLERRLACTLEVVQADAGGFCDPRRMAAAVARRPDLVVMGHASNVTGTLQDVEAVAAACREAGVPLVVDAAQTAGAVPIDARGWGVGALAFTGHKSLLGPQGTGGLVVDPDLASRMRPFRTGGSGVHSESELQPEDLPEKLEAGTVNGPGLAGLGAGARFLLDRGVGAVREHEMALWRRLRAGLSELPQVRVFGQDDPDRSVGIVSVAIDGLQPTDVGFLLDTRFGILTRTGLHCAPCAHRTIGTLPLGTVRFSIGWSTSAAEIDAVVDALAELRPGRADPVRPPRARLGADDLPPLRAIV